MGEAYALSEVVVGYQVYQKDKETKTWSEKDERELEYYKWGKAYSRKATKISVFTRDIKTK